MRKKSREMGADWALEVVLANNEFWDGAANRLYYAAFHALCALLINDGVSVHTHHGVNSMLQKKSSNH